MFNLPKNPQLNVESIKYLSDSELNWAIFKDINEEIEKDNKKTMTRGQEAFYSTWILENEVMNGGFNQFYFNRGPGLMDIAIRGFVLLGADKHEKLAKRAHEVFVSIKEDLMKLNDGTLESFSKSYKDNPLNVFDEEFYDLEREQPLEKIRAQYIRQHAEEFVG